MKLAQHKRIEQQLIVEKRERHKNKNIRTERKNKKRKGRNHLNESSFELRNCLIN